MLLYASKPAIRRARAKALRGVAAGLALLLSHSAWSAMPADEALELVSAMASSENSYRDIVLALVGDGRTLPEAIIIAMQVITPYQQRTALTRTVLCMCQDIEEAELVTSAAISVVTPGDPVVNAIVNEFVMYQRSSCLSLKVETVGSVPQANSSGRLEPDVSPSF